jgi:ATP-dependent RNA helicase DDX47/RRP3
MPEESPTFASLGVCDELCKACARLGWKGPTPIQLQAIPPAIEGKDVIGLAETGSGKTGAFALPMLQALRDNPRPFFGLVLAPTRELATQIADCIDALGAEMGARTARILGGESHINQAVALARKPHIVVGTLGRLIDHLENTDGFSLSGLRWLVMDEADRLLNQDFEKQLDTLLRVVPAERSTMLFSATMTDSVTRIQRATLRQNRVRIQVSDSAFATVAQLNEAFILAPEADKDLVLADLLTGFAGKTGIIFVTQIARLQRLFFLLEALACVSVPVIPLHGKMSQDKRNRSLHRFKALSAGVGDADGSSGAVGVVSGPSTPSTGAILLATDVAARGLDIPAVAFVINYDVPMRSKEYVHRVGRTARAGRSGEAVTIVTQYTVNDLLGIEKGLERKIPMRKPDLAKLKAVYFASVDAAQKDAAMLLKDAAEAATSGEKRRRNADGDVEEMDSAGVMGRPAKRRR